MKPAILFVDDDRAALASFRRQFENIFDVHIAQGPEAALELLQSAGPFKVVVSDLKMPHMDGITFLSQAQKIAPDMMRMLLTGYADMDSAMEAVNRGHVFRFLTKPCPTDLLLKALQDAVEQYDLIRSRQELHTLIKVNRLMEGIITGLARLVEVRDPYTAGHQRRVAELTCAIARPMGYVEERIKAMHIAGMLHDIGKVYVPSDFLNRPGRLLPEEFAVIKMHPNIGYDILKSVEFDWPIASIIHQHHERFDGSGYPQGLAGHDILEEARIIMIADVIDAMSSHRPYRAGLGLDRALDEIRTNAGRFYDPLIAEAALDVFEDPSFRESFTKSLAKPFFQA